MGDSAKKENDSIRFDSLLCQNPPRQSTPGILDSDSEAAGPVHRSHDCRDIAANVSHDAI